jgi:type IV pilus assembly protein PilM
VALPKAFGSVHPGIKIAPYASWKAACLRKGADPDVFRLGRSKGVVGLDIGSSAVKAVELKASGRTYRVTAYGAEAVPPDSIVDGAIIDAVSVADAIRRAFDQAGTRTRDVAASLSGNAVIVKKISLPIMTDAELAESIRWEAEQYIPFDIQDVNLDHQILEAGSEPSKGTMDVLLVAAKKDKINDYSGVIAQAGRQPVVIDVDAFAIQNAFEANYDIDPGVVTVLMNIGASGLNINIVSGVASVFTRDISTGGNAYTEAVQREFNLSFEHAESVKRGRAVEGVGPDDVRPVLRAVTETVLLEVQKTFDFYRATAPSDRLDRVLVCGGASLTEGLLADIAERFNLPVEPLNPFRRIVFDEAKFGVGAGEADATAVVAVGLALRRAGDR